MFANEATIHAHRAAQAQRQAKLIIDTHTKAAELLLATGDFRSVIHAVTGRFVLPPEIDEGDRHLYAALLALAVIGQLTSEQRASLGSAISRRLTL